MQPDTTAKDANRALSTFDQYTSRLPIAPSLLKFIIVGAVAYVVSQAGLFLWYEILPVLPAKDTNADFVLFTHPDVRLLIASALAVEGAIIFKFFAHEFWTFRDRARHHPAVVRFLQFNLGSALSPVIIVATVNVLTPVFGMSPYIATTIGTVLGFAVNWAVSHYIIWPHVRAAPEVRTP